MDNNQQYTIEFAKGKAAENKFEEDNNRPDMGLKATKTPPQVDMKLGIDFYVEAEVKHIKGYKDGKDALPLFVDVKSTSIILDSDYYKRGFREDYRQFKYMHVAYEDSNGNPGCLFKSKADYFAAYLQYLNYNQKQSKYQLYSGWYYFKYSTIQKLCLSDIENISTIPNIDKIWITEHPNTKSKLFCIPVNVFFNHWTFWLPDNKEEGFRVSKNYPYDSIYYRWDENEIKFSKNDFIEISNKLNEKLKNGII
jgi:hypothetical protein